MGHPTAELIQGNGAGVLWIELSQQLPNTIFGDWCSSHALKDRPKLRVRHGTIAREVEGGESLLQLSRCGGVVLGHKIDICMHELQS